MAASEIEALIKAALPDARVTVEDLAGDGDHYAATRGLRDVPRRAARQAAPDRLCRPARPYGGRAARPRVANLSARIGHLHQEFCQWPRRRLRPHPERSRGQNPVMLYMKGTADVPAMRVLRPRGADPDPSGRAVQFRQRAGGRRSCARASSILQWPTIPQLYVEGRIRRRLRHRHGDVPVRRAGDACWRKRASPTARRLDQAAETPGQSRVAQASNGASGALAAAPREVSHYFASHAMT